MGSISGPSHSFRAQRSSSNKIPNHLQTEGFQSILSGLGIDKQSIISLTLLKGLQTDLKFQEAQLIEVTQEQTEVLKGLGISNAHLAIVLHDEKEIERIKKRLKEIREKTLSLESLDILSHTFGIELDENSTIFSDKAGGVVVIKTGLREIKSSILD